MPYAGTTGREGFGTTLSYADTSNGTYTPVAEVFEIEPPEVTVKEIDFSNNDTTGGYREFKPGTLKDGGEVKATLNYAKAQDNTIIGLIGVSKFWKITYPDAATEVFAGFIKVKGKSVPYDDKMTSSITIKVAGAITFTPGA